MTGSLFVLPSTVNGNADKILVKIDYSKTLTPTAVPTTVPSMRPTRLPSVQPSAPSVTPSVTPSAPTYHPTNQPFLVPTTSYPTISWSQITVILGMSGITCSSFTPFYLEALSATLAYMTSLLLRYIGYPVCTPLRGVDSVVLTIHISGPPEIMATVMALLHNYLSNKISFMKTYRDFITSQGGDVTALLFVIVKSVETLNTSPTMMPVSPPVIQKKTQKPFKPIKQKGEGKGEGKGKGKGGKKKDGKGKKKNEKASEDKGTKNKSNKGEENSSKKSTDKKDKNKKSSHGSGNSNGKHKNDKKSSTTNNKDKTDKKDSHDKVSNGESSNSKISKGKKSKKK
eukprot:CAMPEP_0182423762 /NCGR_PEP_ID=MMETSP1167-20130531/9853_1 /TAXON_ID=2988 /ORGANISM="Mallomonas Sp, Strain CCMP3275" /LENGTH=340 /DNA_ID=CAMNT_0024603035 /DNA_START=53 /DNA_END=1075 /DNA_ORIENTATION=-